MIKRKPVKWTFGLFYMRDKAQTLRLLSGLEESALVSLMNSIDADNPCVGCAGLYDLGDRMTPHAAIFALHPEGAQWSATLCKACVDEHPDSEGLLRFAVKRFPAGLDQSTFKRREKETAEAVNAVLDRVRRKR